MRPILLVMTLLILPELTLAAEDRFAIVIGNASYKEGPLVNSVNDAREVAASLRDVGFHVYLVEDASSSKMRKELSSIRDKFAPNGVGLFYFSGHALQHNGINYLLPVDYTKVSVGEIAARALRVDEVLSVLHNTGMRMVIIILDACRNNPFGKPRESLGPGLAVLQDSPGETLIAYATSAGKVASAGVGPNSPFTAALVSALQWPGLGIYDVFRRVRTAVREATGGLQVPWVAASLESDFVFRSHTLTEVPNPDEATPASVLWQTIATSTNPIDYARFLESRPEPALELQTKRRQEKLTNTGAVSTPPPDVMIRPPDLVPGSILESLTECDIAVARPGDPRRLTDGVPSALVNTRLALRACAAALAQDPHNPRLQYQLGRALDIAARFDEARQFYQKAAQADYPAALFALSFMYRAGRGLDPEPDRAVTLMRRAAMTWFSAARNTMGYHYLQGIGVPRSPEEAVRWIKLAADDGWANAIDQLATLYRRGQGVSRDGHKALELYKRAAELGSTNAMNNIGWMLRNGDGVPQDLKAARDWLERGVAAGNAYAARELGVMYRRGLGVEKDTAKAIQLYELAAERGYIEAYIDRASMLETGDGLTKDLAEAYFYYRLTLEAGKLREGDFSNKHAEEGVYRITPMLHADTLVRIEERLSERLKVVGPVPPLHVI